ncbi:MAG: PaeR7I family type II restriction endonuclease [Planctomycetota bacterium]|nr:PaeR7I family type II restriction endonuclease [Planctomycetota bacterium]
MVRRHPGPSRVQEPPPPPASAVPVLPRRRRGRAARLIRRRRIFNSACGDALPHFDVMPEFNGSSYRRRYELFCNKLVSERWYGAACFLTSSSADIKTGDFRTPNPHLSFRVFLASMLSAVLVYRARKETAE